MVDSERLVMNKLRAGVLAALREAEGFVSGQRLCEELNVSRAAISKHVGELRKMGYDIESVPRHGHRLISTVDTPSDVEVCQYLKTEIIGKQYIFETELPSTNSYLSDMPLRDCSDGMVVVADKQTAGRGRMQREWYSPAGANLHFSILLQPKRSISEIPQLTLLAALAVVKALDSAVPQVRADIKWPNDILVGGRKLAGILCEMQAEADAVQKVILGMGINVNLATKDFPAILRKLATSLRIEAGVAISRPHLMGEVLNSLDAHYRKWLEEGLDPFLPELRDRLLLVGKRVRVKAMGRDVAGVVQGLSREGGLIIKDGTKTETVFSGEVHVE